MTTTRCSDLKYWHIIKCFSFFCFRFQRKHIIDSVNIPFTSVQLGDVRLESLNIPDLEKQLTNKIVIIVSSIHENAILVNMYIIIQ